MDETQEATRHFLTEILRATGWTPYKLAKEAEVSHTTISRFVNDESVTHTLSARTLGKIRRAASRVLQPDHIDDLWLRAQRHPAQTPPPGTRVGRG